MHKEHHTKMTWLNDVESALHIYRQQHPPSSSAEGERTAQNLSLIEQHIKDTKTLIRHSRLGHGYVMSMMGIFELPGPAARHNHAKALHQYRRKLNHYEHLKERLRKDGFAA